MATNCLKKFKKIYAICMYNIYIINRGRAERQEEIGRVTYREASPTKESNCLFVF